MKLPKCNGRPQLWHWVSDDGRVDRLRIIYPNGKVSFTYFTHQPGVPDWHDNGCTSRSTQRAAVKAAHAYLSGSGELVFLGYL